jgi:hypothetical protein
MATATFFTHQFRQSAKTLVLQALLWRPRLLMLMGVFQGNGRYHHPSPPRNMLKYWEERTSSGRMSLMNYSDRGFSTWQDRESSNTYPVLCCIYLAAAANSDRRTCYSNAPEQCMASVKKKKRK